MVHGAQFRSWGGGGQPLHSAFIVCPYRDTDAAQPLAIWRGSLVCWLTIFLDCGFTHNNQPPLRRERERESLFSLIPEEGFGRLEAPDFNGSKPLTQSYIEAKEPQRVSYLKTPHQMSGKTTRWIIDSYYRPHF